MGCRDGDVISVLMRVAVDLTAGVDGDPLRLRFRDGGEGVVSFSASSMSSTRLGDLVERFLSYSSSLISTVPLCPSEKVEINFELRVLRRGLVRAFEEIALKIRVVSCESLDVRMLAVRIRPVTSCTFGTAQKRLRI